MDFWRVNSYGYPNPLVEDEKSQEAWQTLLSFFDFNSYSDLKQFWASGDATRRISSHAVESWKSTFEEFGLLYVISRSDNIQITPAGNQFRLAAESQNESLLAWIGLSLLFRYPLKGPRRPKSSTHGTSDLLLYRFLFAAMYDLNGYFWWSELERVLCRTFVTEQAPSALIDVQLLRANPSELAKFPIPAKKRQGAFYNSLNQVVVHASLNHMLLDKQADSTFYGEDEPKRRHAITREWLPLIRDALNLTKADGDCDDSSSAVSRLPQAPNFDTEEEYFNYLGSAIPHRTTEGASRAFPTLSVGGDTVAVLQEGDHFHYAPPESDSIKGEVSVLCRLSVGQRIVLSSDMRWTHIVISKQIVSASEVAVNIRKARPISDSTIFTTILEGENG